MKKLIQVTLLIDVEFDDENIGEGDICELVKMYTDPLEWNAFGADFEEGNVEVETISHEVTILGSITRNNG